MLVIGMRVLIFRSLYSRAPCQTMLNAFSRSSSISCVILFLFSSIVAYSITLCSCINTRVFFTESELLWYDYVVVVKMLEEMVMNDFF